MKTFLFTSEGLQIAITETDENNAKKRLENLIAKSDELLQQKPIVFENVPAITVSFEKTGFTPEFTE